MQQKHRWMMLMTFIVEALLTYGVARMSSVRFIEVMFLAGAAFAIGIYFFSSSGGAMTRFYTSSASAQTGIILGRERFQVKLGPAFVASLIFCLIGLVFFLLLVTGIIPPVSG